LNELSSVHNSLYIIKYTLLVYMNKTLSRWLKEKVKIETNVAASGFCEKEY